MSNVKMTKAQLIEAIEHFPDDTPVVVALGLQPVRRESFEWFDDKYPMVWSVASRTDAIVLEL